MSEEDIFNHLFNDTAISKLDIANMCDKHDVPYKYYHGKRKMCEDIARFIAGTGLFQRIADSENQ